jgi:hypothetical protein
MRVEQELLIDCTIIVYVMNASTPTLTTIGPADAPTSSPSAAPITADCKDRIFSGLETDLDCGGPVCSACRRAGAVNRLYY